MLTFLTCCQSDSHLRATNAIRLSRPANQTPKPPHPPPRHTHHHHPADPIEAVYSRISRCLFGLLCEVCRPTRKRNEVLSPSSLLFQVAAALSSSSCVLDSAAAIAAGECDFIAGAVSSFFFLDPQLVLSRQLRKRSRSSLIFSTADRPPHGLACVKLHSKNCLDTRGPVMALLTLDPGNLSEFLPELQALWK